jgi:ligand-binding sensor domain-containing protein
MLNMRSLPLCFLFLCGTVSVWAVNPRNHISQYGHTAWRVQDGFLGGAAFSITQTTDGYLWIATKASLVRFDGVRFVPWAFPDGTHLPSSDVASLLGAHDGSLWIGMEGGLSHWDKGVLTNSLINPGRINSIIEDRNGAVWFTRSRGSDADGGLCQIIGTGMRCYGKADGLPGANDAESLAEDNLGNLWIGSSSTVVRWKPGSSSTRTWGLKSIEGMDGAAGLAANPDGSVWVGIALAGRGLGFQQLVQGAWKSFVSPELDGSTLEVHTLFRDRENALWIGTINQGIYRILGRNVEHFNSADGLSGDMVLGFYEDREGNLWVATSKGIDCFRDVRVATFSTREELATPEVDSVLAAQDGTVWVGGGHALDAIHQDGVLSSLQAGKGLPGNQVTSLPEDHAGRLWVGVDKTISIYKDGRFSSIGRPDGSLIGLVVGMTEDVDNNIWVETTGPPMTLSRIRDLKVQEMFPVPQMPAARKVAADPRGGIWLGLMNGDLARYRHGKTEIFAFKHREDSRVNQLMVNSDGSVLGATPLGLVGWKEGKQQTLTVRNGLPCDTVYALIEDSQRALWLYTQCGLVENCGCGNATMVGAPGHHAAAQVF